MSVQDLRSANERLRNEIWDLRDTIANLDAENQELIKGKKDTEALNRGLQTKTESVKLMVEELQKEVESLRAILEQREGKIKQLELENKNLDRNNKQLALETYEISCQISAYEDHAFPPGRDLFETKDLPQEIKGYVKHLEGKLEAAEQQHDVEKHRSSQLRETLAELLQIRERQRKDIIQLRGQLETSMQQAALQRLENKDGVQAGLVLLERVDAKLVEQSLSQSEMSKLPHWLLNLGRFLLILVPCLGIGTALALLYTYFVNPYFIADSLLLLFRDQEINMIIEVLSHHLTWKHDGLFPF
nr:involucrin-like [Pelodiscus sinensis]XP_025045665.1 involucrin-like [Pelodiscus sinensis]XP_025045666.1 involucrin-like [Pelodiscus sinensis]XP_025045667.1 involucrin-like [Pelodiscus sinensis]|eukprot:XP_006133653.1 involucrin-like [Pelodiscus sinensis]